MVRMKRTIARWGNCMQSSIHQPAMSKEPSAAAAQLGSFGSGPMTSALVAWLPAGGPGPEPSRFSADQPPALPPGHLAAGTRLLGASCAAARGGGSLATPADMRQVPGQFH
jgi:hypothetical protein